MRLKRKPLGTKISVDISTILKESQDHLSMRGSLCGQIGFSHIQLWPRKEIDNEQPRINTPKKTTTWGEFFQGQSPVT